jgi:hypothetical protein
MSGHGLQVDGRAIAAGLPGPSSRRRRHRHIGVAGAAARGLLGGVLVGSVVWGHARSGVDLWAWVIGLGLFPLSPSRGSAGELPAIPIVWCG